MATEAASLVLPGFDRSDGDDSELVVAAQNDTAAFALIYERYADRVFSYLRSRFANAGAADDLTQQAFTRALQSLQTYRPGKAPFSAWLFRIARNVAIDAIRRERLATVPLEFVPETALLPDDTGDTLLEQRLPALRRALAGIPPRQRELVALRYAGGLTAREIGQVVGRSEAAVQKQLTRTLATLKEHYSDETLL